MPQPVYTKTRELAGWRKIHDLFRFYFWWWFNHLYARVCFRLTIEGEENIPTGGAALLTSNHISYLDANIISAASPRKVSFMVAKEYYDSEFLRWMCDFLGCIPVNREEPEIGTVKEALKKLSKGMLVGCFPEGGISTSGEMNDAKAGIGLMAIRTGCPVVPICLSGYRFQSMPKTFFLPKRVSIRIGKPLSFPEEDHRNRESLERVTQRIVDAIKELGKSDSG